MALPISNLNSNIVILARELTWTLLNCSKSIYNPMVDLFDQLFNLQLLAELSLELAVKGFCLFICVVKIPVIWCDGEPYFFLILCLCHISTF